MSRVSTITTYIRGRITLLIATHEPPSRESQDFCGIPRLLGRNRNVWGFSVLKFRSVRVSGFTS